MAVVREIRRRAPHIVPQVAAACLVAYFAYHAVQGDGGIMAYLRTQEALKEAKATRSELRAERRALEQKVELLRPDTLDPDLLSERARAVLNMAQDDAVVVLPPETSRGN